MPTEYSWNADADSWRWRLDLLEQLLACYQQALGHKLRNQVITIRGMANLLELELGDQLKGEARGFLDRLTKVAGETGDLIKALDDLGRLCRDGEPCIRVELAEVVRETTTEVKLLYPERSIEYDLQEKMPVVSVPRRALHLVLVRLFCSTVETAGERGALSIRVTVESAGSGIALHIAASGRGLAEAELAQLFKRLRSGAVAADQGLDLFLVRQAAALWGGGVGLQSEPGCGITFTLRFAQAIND